MPAERLPMRKIKELLRLKFDCGLTDRQIGRSLGLGRTTVGKYLKRFALSGLSYPLPDEVDDAWLSERLFPPVSSLPPPLSRPLPSWPEFQQELRKKGVTLMLLWEEYREQHPEGYQYSRFCELYRLWLSRRDLVLRQEYKAGKKMFVDYAGKTIPVVNPVTGEVREAQIFVSVLGASNYTFSEATWTQTLPDWIGSHVRAFEYYGGTTDELIPDNLKSGVTYACFYEPYLNTTYEKMAAHYGMAVTGHFYSVPYILKGQKVDVRYTAATVEVLHNGKRVASHVRSFLKGKYTTLKEHLPKSHLEYLDWPPSRLENWAKTIGPHAQNILEAILTEPVYPVQGYRRCLGILRLGKQYGEERLEKACERALAIRSLSYQTVKSILKTGTDKRPLRRLQQEALPLDHDNIRGPRYFH